MLKKEKDEVTDWEEEMFVQDVEKIHLQPSSSSLYTLAL